VFKKHLLDLNFFLFLILIDKSIAVGDLFSGGFILKESD
jgi:hypothetical protein